MEIFLIILVILVASFFRANTSYKTHNDIERSIGTFFLNFFGFSLYTILLLTF